MDLAIVIPAYKPDFLDQALASIEAQTVKKFKVYIGDDCSPYDIASIVNRYKQLINLVYLRFENNLGQSSLVKHWERCIDMSADEKWIWLFSDDDMMDKNCVASFFDSQKKAPQADVFRFDLETISADNTVKKTTHFPISEKPEEYILKRFKQLYDSAVTNFIFSRKAYSQNGMIDFPMAWCSDDASLLSMAGEGFIESIKGANVQWRLSGKNISTDNSTIIKLTKARARLLYLEWLYRQNRYRFLERYENRYLALKWFLGNIVIEFDGFNVTERTEMFKRAEAVTGISVEKYKRVELLIAKKERYFSFVKNVTNKMWKPHIK